MLKNLPPKTKSAFAGRLSRLVQSVRFRLSLWYVIILAVVVLVFGSVIYSVEATSLAGEIDAELKFVAEKIPQVLNTEAGNFKLTDQAALIVEQLLRQNLPVPEPVRSQLKDIPIIGGLLQGKFVVAFVDGQNRLTQAFGAMEKGQLDRLRELAATGSKENSFQVFTTSTPDSTGQDYRVYLYPVQQNNRLAGTIIVGLPWEGAATLRVLLATLLLTGTITLILAAAGGYWLASRAMRPVSDITRTARNISETDLSRRLNNPRQDEIGELAGTFDRMLGRLQSAFERQRQFTADASHELRTPLTIINLEVSRSLSRPRSSEEYQKALEIIQVENEYMARLVEDLLILARADTGQANLNAEPLDLSDLALEVVERLASLAEQQGVRLLAGELPEIIITGDRHYLTQMLANLIGNAIKYTAGTGDTVRVETGFTTGNYQPNRAWLCVTDNGPGIAPEHMPHLFDRFYQADRSRNTALSGATETATESLSRGSGLGLSIVKWVAEAHQGTVMVQSQPGKGTSIEVSLPGKAGNIER